MVAAQRYCRSAAGSAIPGWVAPEESARHPALLKRWRTRDRSPLSELRLDDSSRPRWIDPFPNSGRKPCWQRCGVLLRLAYWVAQVCNADARDHSVAVERHGHDCDNLRHREVPFEGCRLRSGIRALSNRLRGARAGSQIEDPKSLPYSCPADAGRTPKKTLRCTPSSRYPAERPTPTLRAGCCRAGHGSVGRALKVAVHAPRATAVLEPPVCGADLWHPREGGWHAVASEGLVPQPRCQREAIRVARAGAARGRGRGGAGPGGAFAGIDGLDLAGRSRVPPCSAGRARPARGSGWLGPMP